MRRLMIRFIALVLLPALLIDPALAMSFARQTQSAPAQSARVASSVSMESQALTLSLPFVRPWSPIPAASAYLLMKALYKRTIRQAGGIVLAVLGGAAQTDFWRIGCVASGVVGRILVVFNLGGECCGLKNFISHLGAPSA